MDLASVHSLYDVLAADRFDLVYSGRFHDEHTADLIAIGEDASAQSGYERAHRQRLSFVMVEAYQNIVRHRARLSETMERGAGRSLFVMRARDGGDEVVAMDPVADHETRTLDEVLARIGGSDLQQLKQLFLDRLRDGSRTVRGGAGLGLIEMARRSGNGMRHELLPLDAGHRLFVLQVVVGGPTSKATPKDELMRLHTLVASNDLLLLCRSGGSPSAAEAVLRMLEKDEGDGSSGGVKRAFLAATDWLRQPGLSERSFVAVGRDRDAHSLVAGGCVPRTDVERWSSEVAWINSLSPADRERHYRNSMLGRTSGRDFNTGLLDLARQSAEPLRMAVYQVQEGSRFLVEAIVR
ncbi:MAG: hypothetical protein IPL52_06320 [Flavobacteriales bacterium]|nr:hypothetical protein [Flavobacteriales bacterium]